MREGTLPIYVLRVNVVLPITNYYAQIHIGSLLSDTVERFCPSGIKFPKIMRTFLAS